ncbi:LuxR C-terminal-related transcriptional regulator [Niveibacterium terrae]|uniref:helix-turn-helix transcriptional regulator n=1 Tax=Niveibacterium terrae TaxID=3373598 RepID=UPI003A8E6882
MSDENLNPPPPFQPDLPRPRVMATLQAALARQIVALICPGGFGKTCALRSFWLEWEGPKAWLDLARAADLLASWGHARSFVEDSGLIVIDGIEHLTARDAPVLAQALDLSPRGIRFILSGRSAGGLPLPLWRSQNRLASLNAHALALGTEEWRELGFTGEAADWAGWWGARQASVLPDAPWDSEFAAWLDQAWLAGLDDASLADLGCAALLPEANAEIFAMLGNSAQIERSLTEVALRAGPLCMPTGGIRLAARYRPYLVAAWRTRSPEAWRSAVETGTSRLLARGHGALAAQIVTGVGDAALASSLASEVLHQAGWFLLLSRHQNLLRALLDVMDPVSGGVELKIFEAAWKVLVSRRPHEAEALVDQLCKEEDSRIAGPAQALNASIALQYDAFACALEHVAASRASFSDDLHPAASLAELIEASTRQALGEFDKAAPLLAHVLSCADRDRLDHLQFEALHRRASAAAQAGDIDLALRWCSEQRQRIQFAGLESAATLDASARLEASLRLRRLDANAARRALESGQGATEAFGHYWSFPYATQQTIASLVENDAPGAREGVAWLEAQLAESFVCLKWKTDALLPRIWLRSREADRDGLLEIAERSAAESWPDTIYRDRRDIYCSAARLLAREAPDLDRLAAIARGENERADLARKLIALAREDSEALLGLVQRSARARDSLDWLWLAPRALAPLETLLGAPALAGDALTRGWLRELIQHLLSPGEGQAQPEPGLRPAQPPAGLTQKEWEVLRLIGEQLTNEQIAARLHVSLATVKTHINHVYSKLAIETRSEAVLKARTL